MIVEINCLSQYIKVDLQNMENVIHGFDTSGAIFSNNVPAWLVARRDDALKRLLEMGFPTDAEEIWRYSRVGELLERDLVLRRDLPKLAKLEELGTDFPDDLADLAASGKLVLMLKPGSASIYEPNGSSEAVVSRALDLGSSFLENIELSSDFFGLYTEAYSEDVYVIDIPKDTVLSGPIVVIVSGVGTSQTFLPKISLKLGDGSVAQLIEAHVGGATDSFVASSTDLYLGDRARLGHFQIQNMNADAYHVANINSYLQREANYQYGAFSFGGHYARVRCENHLLGQASKAYLKAAYFADGNQMLDFRTLQDHLAPNTFSDLLFKGAVAGTSHSVYSGLVRIEEGAIKSDAFQTNRNLVLSSGARADSVPNLDIRENNVRCSHASAVGPIDPELIFYLESRGIDPRTGEQLIVRGFSTRYLRVYPHRQYRSW